MESMINSILGGLLSGFKFISQIAEWCIEQPLAASFWGAVFFSILNSIVKYTPTKVDDSLLDILVRSITNAVTKLGGIKNMKR